MKRLLGLLVIASALAIGCGPGSPEIPEKGEGQERTGGAPTAENAQAMTLDEEIPGQ